MKSIPFLHAAIYVCLGSISSVAATHHTALATFSPCPSCPSKVMPPPITITEQYQTVSTCTPETTCTTYTNATFTNTRNCTTNYPYSTYQWVSTVIPCAGPGTTTSCTVTRTDQQVTVQHWSTAKTDYNPGPTSTIRKPWGNYSTSTTTTTAPPTIKTIEVTIIDYSCPYSDIGPLAIPGYGGSGLCKSCIVSNGGSVQTVTAHKCVNGKCSDYKETWSYFPATKTSISYQPCTTSRVVQTPGVYTITAAPAVVTTSSVNNAPTTITLQQTEYYCPSNGVYTHTIQSEVCVTTSVPVAPTTVHVETTVTRTITITTTVCNTIVSGSTMPPTVIATTTTTTTTPATTSATTPASQTTGPQSTGPQSTGPQSTGPQTTGPQSTGPQSTGPQSTGPTTTCTTGTSPTGTQPGSTSSTVTSPSGSTSPTTTPSSTSPQSTGPTTTCTTGTSPTGSQPGSTSSTTTSSSVSTSPTTSPSSTITTFVTTTSSSTTSEETGSSTTSSKGPDPSSDLDLDPAPIHKMARALKHRRSSNPGVLRRGGILRSTVHEEAAPAVHKRDFSIKKRTLL